jgi:hypothetical protein
MDGGRSLAELVCGEHGAGSRSGSRPARQETDQGIEHSPFGDEPGLDRGSLALMGSSESLAQLRGAGGERIEPA